MLNRGLLAAPVLATLIACSLAVEADREQCAKNEDCVGHGQSTPSVCVAKVCVRAAALFDAGGGADAADAAPIDPVWGCLGNVPPLPVPEETVPVPFYTRFSGLISTKPIAGLPAKACLASDPFCTQPFGEPGFTNDEGIASFQLYSGFLGYVDVGPSAANPDIMPSLYYVHPVPDKNVVVSDIKVPGANILTHGEFQFIAGSAGKAVKPEYGHLFFGALDCRGRFVADTILQADPRTADTFTYYTDSAGTPSTTQAKTTDSGNGGYINLAEGTVKVTLTRESGQRIGSHDVIIRKGAITYLLIGPTR